MKSAIKSFDFFRKTNPDMVQSTRTGGLVSICSVITIVLLTVSQYTIFKEPNMERSAHIASNHDAQEEKVPINFDVAFYSCPCHIISVSQRTGFKDIQGNEIYKGLKRTRITKPLIDKHAATGTHIADMPDYDDHDLKKDDLLKAIKDGEGCRVHGIIDTQKLMGTIMIGTDRGAWLL